jgi:hypothetical protein
MSKFQGILQARRAPSSVPDISDTQKPESPAIRVSEKKRGRPAAKRSDPDFLQVTAYIRKETHRKTKIRLLEEGQGREFSELVEVMLEEWLDRKQ